SHTALFTFFETHISSCATRGSFEQGSLAALIIVAVGILPVVPIPRYTDATTPHNGRRAQHPVAAVAAIAGGDCSLSRSAVENSAGPTRGGRLNGLWPIQAE